MRKKGAVITQKEKKGFGKPVRNLYELKCLYDYIDIVQTIFYEQPTICKSKCISKQKISKKNGQQQLPNQNSNQQVFF